MILFSWIFTNKFLLFIFQTKLLLFGSFKRKKSPSPTQHKLKSLSRRTKNKSKSSFVTRHRKNPSQVDQLEDSLIKKNPCANLISNRRMKQKKVYLL